MARRPELGQGCRSLRANGLAKLAALPDPCTVGTAAAERLCKRRLVTRALVAAWAAERPGHGGEIHALLPSETA
jgi:hypothetical protein